MTNAPVQSKDNNDVILNQMLNISSSDKFIKKDDNSFSNLINTTAANVEKTQSNFISKAAKSNTSSINKLALKPLKKLSLDEIKKQKFQTLNQDTNYQTSDIADTQLSSDIVLAFSQLQNNQEKQDNTDIFADTKNTDSDTNLNSSDIDNSSPVNPSPVFYSDEQINNAVSQKDEIIENDELLKDIVQNVLLTCDIDIPKDDIKKIEETISNLETISDVEETIQAVENIFKTSDYPNDDKENIQQALDKIKDLIKQAQEKIEPESLDSAKSKELLNTVFLKMLENKSNELTSSNEIGKISKEDIKTAIEQTDITQSDAEVLKNAVQDIQKLLNTAQTALDNNDFEALNNLSESINSLISDLDSVLNNKNQKPADIAAFSSDLINALKNLNKNLENLNSENLNTDEISSSIQTLSEVKLPDVQNNSKKLKEEILSKLNQTDFDKLSKTDTKKLNEILELLNDSDDEAQINSDDLIKQLNQISEDSKEKTTDILKEVNSKIESFLNVDQKNLQKPQLKENQPKTNESFEILDSEIVDKEINLSENLTQEDFSKEDFSKDKSETIPKKEVSSIHEKNETGIQKQGFIKELDEDILLDIDYKSDNQTALSVSDEIIRLSMNEENSLNSNNPVGNITYDNNVLIKSTPHEININQTHPQEKTQPTSDIFNQIGDKLTQLKDGSQKLTMVLRPNDLGRLSIELTTNDSGLSANILAQNDDVRAYIEKNINTLRQQLSDSGISVNSIQIKTSGSSDSTNYGGNNGNDSQEHNQQNFNEQDNHNRQNQKQRQEALAQMSNYDLHFAKDFSTIIDKTISYNLN